MESWVGASAQLELTVTDADTAQTVGSGDVPVLATPRVLALAEAATVRALARRLESGTTTVGTRVELSHKAPTPIGRTVLAVATLVTVDGRRLTFDVTVKEGESVVAEARVERVLVNRSKFLETALGS
jgi:predicted thioesterase